MRVWRCIRRRRLDAPYSGEGSERAAGRWHSRGTRVVYSSDSAALAVLEVAVNVGAVRPLLDDYVVCPADVPDELVATVDEFPPDWDGYPRPASTQRLGDDWVADSSLPALRVPSAVVPGWNVLLNPKQPGFQEITVHASQATAIAPGRTSTD